VKYVINGTVFKSRTALQNHIRGILNQTEIGATVFYEHRPFLEDLFKRHSSYEEKAGSGIGDIRVVHAMPYKTRCFEIERVDGTRTDISYLECLKPSTVFDWFPAACRSAVVEQIKAFKASAFAVSDRIACPVTHEAVTRETCHVDHAPPWTFETIVESFLGSSVLDLAQIEFKDGDGVTTYEFLDRELAEMFAAYHAERASLRVVSKRTNLSLLRKGR
jgi:hypothetical protein